MELTSYQVRLLVTDFPACFEFYRDVMGFKVGFGTPDEVYADYHTGSISLALFRRELMSSVVGTSDKPVDADAQDAIALCLGVEDVDGIAEMLQAKGVTLITPPTDRPHWGQRTIHFRDPSGNLIEMYHNIPMED